MVGVLGKRSWIEEVKRSSNPFPLVASMLLESESGCVDLEVVFEATLLLSSRLLLVEGGTCGAQWPSAAQGDGQLWLAFCLSELQFVKEDGALFSCGFSPGAALKESVEWETCCPPNFD